MKMKLLLPLLLALMLCCPALADTRVMVVSDLHLMAPELYEGSDLLERSLRGGDGKVSYLSRELADGLVAEVLHQQPDVLVVTGDLSFNGESKSHKYVAQTLQRVTDAGIPVCVIPGNHDICTWIAKDYSGDGSRAATTIEARNFGSIYANFMPGEKAPQSCGFSYVYKASDTLWLLMLDTNWYDPEEGQAAGGYVRDGMTEWVASVLRDAQSCGAEVISATHQALYPHSDFKSSLYMVNGGDQLASLMTVAGMRLNLSGHVHAQHLLQTDGLWDAQLGAFCLSPHLYAMITLTDEGTLRYEAAETCGEHFPEGFTEETRARFLLSVENHVTIPDGITEEEAPAVIRLKDKVNYAYFGGLMGDLAQWIGQDEDWLLLQEIAPESDVVSSVRRLLREATVNMRQLELNR